MVRHPHWATAMRLGEGEVLRSGRHCTDHHQLFLSHLDCPFHLGIEAVEDP